jgi:hypothetical protein
MMSVDVLSDDDKNTIRNFARGYGGFRSDAIAIHRASMRIHGLRHGDPFFDFMSEIDNPCPDLMLRARYRDAVLKTAQGEQK